MTENKKELYIKRKEEIDSMTTDEFRQIIHNVTIKKEFSKLFNRSVEGITEEEKVFLKNLLIDNGVKGPINDIELEYLCGLITNRSLTYI